MLYIKIFILMLFCHIIDDFVLQSFCLSNLKQKDWWNKNAYLDKDGKYDWESFELYKNDYIAALIVHALSWSIMIHFPIMFLMPNKSMYAIGFSILINCIIHAYVDNLKANKKKINLILDQYIHLLQIGMIMLIFIF